MIEEIVEHKERGDEYNRKEKEEIYKKEEKRIVEINLCD